MESLILFTLFFILFCLCFLYPPAVFVSLGLTIESLFSFYLNNGGSSFIHYHIKRTVVTLMTHCSIPLAYALVVGYMFPELTISNVFWKVFVTLSLIPPTVCACIIFSWSKMNWLYHPIAIKLKKFITYGANLNQITRDIDNEYNSINKVIIRSNAVTQIVATENWLIKISPYDLHIAHQSDISLVVSSSNQYQYVMDREESSQYLNIDVISNRADIDSFKIRINSSDFKDLQERISRPINIMGNIVIHQSLIDQFLEAFREHVQLNPKIDTNENLDVCIGCMMATPNVKLFTSCGELPGPRKCTMCYCKPMWCVDCMGKWFASRQDQDKPETWLSSKCTCPMCRNTFCILDVCPVAIPVGSENHDDVS